MATGKHMWVAMSYVVIEPAIMSDGSLGIYATEAQLEAAEEDTKHACWHCHTPLTCETLFEDCPGGS